MLNWSLNKKVVRHHTILSERARRHTLLTTKGTYTPLLILGRGGVDCHNKYYYRVLRKTKKMLTCLYLGLWRERSPRHQSTEQMEADFHFICAGCMKDLSEVSTGMILSPCSLVCCSADCSVWILYIWRLKVQGPTLHHAPIRMHILVPRAPIIPLPSALPSGHIWYHLLWQLLHQRAFKYCR